MFSQRIRARFTTLECHEEFLGLRLELHPLIQQARKQMQTKMEKSMLNITYKDRRTNVWVWKRIKVINIISDVRKVKWTWQGTSTASKMTYGIRVSQRGNHMTRKYVKGDQPSGGETAWTNTGATDGRGQHKTG